MTDSKEQQNLLLASRQGLQKDMTLDLHIKTVHMDVGERTPVMVIWSRGNKKATTKIRVLTEQKPTAVIDDKFQINTVMEVDENGVPVKDKMVRKNTIIINLYTV